MNLTVFYAWQNDLPNDINRYLIRDAVKEATRDIRNDAEVEESPRIDHDTKGVSGTPDISATINEKIIKSSVFIADVTFVGTAEFSDCRDKPKIIPNPNVMLELGFAAHAIGWLRIILVMNEAFGSPDRQIFDLRNKRYATTYHLENGADADERKKVEDVLRVKLAEYIKAAFREEHAEVGRAIERLDINCLRLMFKTGVKDSFAAPEPNVDTFGASDGLNSSSFNSAVLRLIDLDLLRSNIEERLYAYHWTALGTMVLRELGYRE